MLTLREKQRPPPGDWLTWLILGGRGWGKTTAGAHWCRQMALEKPGRQIVAVGGRAVLAELMKACDEYKFSHTERRFEFKNGSTVEVIPHRILTEELERSRGLGFDGIWCDDPDMWDDQGDSGIDALRARMLPDARMCITSWAGWSSALGVLRALGTVVTHGTTHENAENLPSTWFDDIQKLDPFERLQALGETPGAWYARLEDSAVSIWNPHEADDELRRRLLGPGPLRACECGARACGSEVHSSWCAAGRK